ncbi:hypothetical protein F5Y18DRAFT_57463 [Xylariaceae sp. FL1019]|nr:hypothetical protein F5Y18DRAFT_57463 [Xylariaceae sp. FL1019]
MSVPPQLIRVKRKATEEAPVSYLRVQESKRHRSEVFVYQRQRHDQDATFAQTIPLQHQRPVIHVSALQPKKPQPRSQATPSDLHVKHDTPIKSTTDDSPDDDSPDAAIHSAPAPEPRKFHMSRQAISLSSSSTDLRHGISSRKRAGATLFVERRIKRISSRTLQKFHAASNSPSPALQPTSTLVTQDMELDRPEPRKLKKPGVAKLASRDSSARRQLPKSMTDRWNVDMDKLTADMEAYAFQQIGLSIQKSQEEDERRGRAGGEREGHGQRRLDSTPSKLKFRPKAPAQRYAERHPQEAQISTDSGDKEMADAGAAAENSDSDDDYIIETYVRVPATTMGDHVPPQSVGLLVFDQEPDIEYFYGADADSEDEWAEDDEDENAENYYTADYPDEEVASDDEFGQNLYAFRNGNASDLEEYDMGDDESEKMFDSDDDEGDGGFRTHVGRSGLKTRHL